MCDMSDPLGLSIGAINLVAMPAGRPPVSRRSVLTLFEQRAPEVGAPEENPEAAEPGVVVRGFVEWVGDPVPLVAADGSAYRGEELSADALDALARLAGYGAPVSIAVPAHWGPGPLEALRGAVRSKPGLAPEGVPPALIPDAAAAIAALHIEPGLPLDGVVALCDFGGSGTSITLVDAAANFAPIGSTVRYRDFSGEQIDQAILNHLLSRVRDTSSGDPAGTAAVGSLTRLRGECRSAKERLSEQAATVIPVNLPGFGGDVRLTRGELNNIIASPLAGALDALADTLARNRVPPESLAAVVIVGGGASIPAIGAQLSERLRAPVITAPRPGFTAATGAVTLTRQQPPPEVTARSRTAADTPTSMAPTAWAAGAAGSAASESAADGDKSATFRAMAWSQDDSRADEPLPYFGEEYTFGAGTGAAPATGPERPDDTDYPVEPEPLAFYKRPVVLFGVAEALALAAIGGLVYTLSGSSSPIGHIIGPGEPSGGDQEPITVTVTAPDGGTSLSTITPPPPSDTTTSSETTTTEPASTTTEPTTTAEPTTTKPTTSAAPPSTTQAPATSEAASTTATPVEPTGSR
jgi:hypothetical protein